MIIQQRHKIIESGDYPELEELYGADAVFDVNVPMWRFKRRGPSEIRHQWAEWTESGPMRLVGWEEHLTPWGAVVQMSFREGPGGQHYSRSLHLLTVEDGRISEHVMYCTGQWDRATVERNRSEAPGMAEEPNPEPE
jgi:ketosteroid isomerase-like protein